MASCGKLSVGVMTNYWDDFPAEKLCLEESPWWKEPKSGGQSLGSGKAEAKTVHLESFLNGGQCRCGQQDCFS